ncbi:hypothetical protein ACFS27_10335 [Promicromonospora vindobonensis]|uniref:Uncharacterized protein n=1 Tax=Promicromonospora vindobonensis TaxID=195748 RepID=A0ABW5VSK7_9MICO
MASAGERLGAPVAGRPAAPSITWIATVRVSASAEPAVVDVAVVEVGTGPELGGAGGVGGAGGAGGAGGGAARFSAAGWGVSGPSIQ